MFHISCFSNKALLTVFLIFLPLTFSNVSTSTSNNKYDCDNDTNKLHINDVTSVPGSCEKSNRVPNDIRGANKLKKMMEKESNIQVTKGK